MCGFPRVPLLLLWVDRDRGLTGREMFIIVSIILWAMLSENLNSCTCVSQRTRTGHPPKVVRLFWLVNFIL